MDEDLEVLVTEGILRTEETFKLEYLHVTAGTSVMHMASINAVKLRAEESRTESLGH